MAHSSKNEELRKRTSTGAYKNQDQYIEEWLNEESEHEFSDVDDG